MPWYYAKDGQRLGPYTDQEFNGMVSQGAIAPDTLVWRDGMQNWLPYAQVGGVAAPAAIAAVPAYTGGASDKPMVVCSSCHRAFPEDDVIQYQGAYICAACKPTFVQQLREGATVAGEMNYAGFWIRFAAFFVDGIILGIFNFATSFIFGFGLGAQDPTNAMAAAQVAISLFQFAVGITYWTYFNGKFGATPGKMACGLRIVTADGQPITYLRAFGRYFALILSMLTLYIGFIIAGFDAQKRALHDHICSTRVIRVS